MGFDSFNSNVSPVEYAEVSPLFESAVSWYLDSYTLEVYVECLPSIRCGSLTTSVHGTRLSCINEGGY